MMFMVPGEIDHEQNAGAYVETICLRCSTEVYPGELF